MRGQNALELEGNAHAQFWLNFVKSIAYDLDDDGDVELLLPSTGVGGDWTALMVDEAGEFVTSSLSGPEGWPAYSDDDGWQEMLALSSSTSTLQVQAAVGSRPDLVFVGAVEGSSDLPLWVNWFTMQGEDAAHRVDKITDGLGATVDFTYDAVFAPEVPSADWPAAPLRAALWVVREWKESATETRAEDHTIEAKASHVRQFEYEGATVERRGLGFLGFRRVITEDLDRQQDIVTEYDAEYDATIGNYPAVGRPVEREVYTRLQDPLNDEEERLHIHFELWEWTTAVTPLPGGVAYHAYAESHREMELDLASDACEPAGYCPYYGSSGTYKDVTTTELRDAFGNLLSSSETFTDGEGPTTTATQSEIVNDTTNWLIGQVGRTSVATCEGGECSTRVTLATFHPSNGSLATSTLQPDEPNLKLSTSYGYDPRGNLNLVVQSGANGHGETETRTTQTHWDAEGVFREVQVNALGQASYLVHDRASGALLAEVDAAGLTQRTTFDGFYRPVGTALHASPLGVHDGAPVTIEYGGAEASVAGSAMQIRTQVVDGQTTYEYRSSDGKTLERRWVGMSSIVSTNPPNPQFIPGGGQIYERFGYDSLGRNVSRSIPQYLGQQPTGWSLQRFDQLDRSLGTTAADGTELTSVSYESNGVTNITVVSEAGKVAGEVVSESAWLNSAGRPLRTIDARGTHTCFLHGPFGKLVRVDRNCHSGGATRVSYAQYDASGNVIAQIDPDLERRTVRKRRDYAALANWMASRLMVAA